MLLPHASRALSLLLLLGVLLDGALQSKWDGCRWFFELWDSKPDLPLGVFTLLRIVVSASAVWDGWTYSRYARLGFGGAYPWSATMFCIAVIYQPIVPLQFPYHFWLWIDLVIAVVLSIHFVLVSGPTLIYLAKYSQRNGNPLTAPQYELGSKIAEGYTQAAGIFSKISTTSTTKEISNPMTRNEPRVGPGAASKQPGAEREVTENAKMGSIRGKEGSHGKTPRGKPPLVDPTHKGPFVDSRPFSQKIAASVELVQRADRVLRRNDLSEEERANALRVKRGAELVLKNRLEQLRSSVADSADPKA